MKVKLAKTAGFCFGVNRAIHLVYDLVRSGEKVCTLGPIIHNRQVVEDLLNRGVRIIENVEEAKSGERIVIRSHGVSGSVYHFLEESKIPFSDATCPFVSKIHRLVSQAADEKKTVFIAGNKSHPEVIGIQGHCQGLNFVFDTPEEFQKILINHEQIAKKEAILVAQTTYQINLWKKCMEIAKCLCTNTKIFDTICNATCDRQSEAIELARSSDLMLVIGDKHSSNTIKLARVCEPFIKTILLESADELRSISFQSVHSVGVTAGASTPAYIIKEVLETMSEIVNNQPEELSFAELLEQSEQQAERLYSGKKIRGIVTSISKNEVQVDIGGKQSGVIPSGELSINPNDRPEDVVTKGQEIDLIVLNVNDQDGIVTLSKKRLDAEKSYEVIIKAKEEDTVLKGVVTDTVRGGVLARTEGIKVFIPLSQLSDRRVENPEEFVGQEVEFKIIEVNPSRHKAVASRRRLLSEKRKEQAEEFWKDAEVGKRYTGTVKSLTNYGAFVDLGGVDGMVHITELSWLKIKHPSDVVNVGDEVEVYIKDIDEENKKISLGYKQSKDNPWEKFKEAYEIGQVVDTKIVSLTQFGAFAEILPGVDGLIHISQIANQHINKVADVLSVGQEVQAKIIDIDFDQKRISLSMRVLLEDEQEKQENENEQSVGNIEGVEFTQEETGDFSE